MASSSRTERLSIAAKQKLIAAAAADHRSVNEFVLRSALDQADAILPDRQYFGLNAEQWAAFMEMLDAPPRELPGVRKLFSEPSLIERSWIDSPQDDDQPGSCSADLLPNS